MHLIAPLTRQAALVSWRAFRPVGRSYASARNRVQSGHGNVSLLGGSIRFRTLLEDEVIEKTCHENDSHD